MFSPRVSNTVQKKTSVPLSLKKDSEEINGKTLESTLKSMVLMLMTMIESPFKTQPLISTRMLDNGHINTALNSDFSKSQTLLDQL